MDAYPSIRRSAEIAETCLILITMYATYHFKSAGEISTDMLEAIKAAFKGKAVVITVEEEQDETAFLSANAANKEMLDKSIEQDRNGESVTVNIPKI